jgi:hypothetical protein
MPSIRARHSFPGIRRSKQGYALFDALAALLLVAGTLLGAGLALVQSLASSRAAAVQTAAVDLAGDLTESLYGVVERERVIADWISLVRRQLPSGTATTQVGEDSGLPSASMLDIVIGWRDQGGRPFRLQLPFALSPPAETS